MEYDASGIDDPDCVQPNRTFRLEVDNRRGIAVASARDGTEIARRHGDGIWLHRSLFASDPGAEWVAADLATTSGADRRAATRVLGVDLAAYLLADRRPSTGPDLVAAALEGTREVTAYARDDRTTSYRLEIPGETLRDAEDDGSPDGWPNGAVVLATLSEGKVLSVAVQPAGTDSVSSGWTIAYGPARQRLTPSTPTDSTVDLEDVAAPSPAAGSFRCQRGAGVAPMGR